MFRSFMVKAMSNKWSRFLVCAVLYLGICGVLLGAEVGVLMLANALFGHTGESITGWVMAGGTFTWLVWSTANPRSRKRAAR